MSNIVREQKRGHAESVIQSLKRQLQQNFLIKRIAQGLQGQVFLVEEMQNIYKTVNYNYHYWFEHLLPLFQNEIQQLIALANTQIIPPFFHDRSDLQNHYYFSQAFMNLGDLWQLVGGNALTNQCILGLSKELLRLVNSLHNLGFYHFDIKQQNFLLHKDYQIVLLQNQNNNIVTREQRLQQLLQILSRNQNIQFQQVTPNYNELQRILNRNDQTNIQNFQFLNNEEIFQFIYWVNQYLEQNQIQNFDPCSISSKQSLRIVFCDLGFTQHNNIPLNSVGTFGYRSPFMILYPKVGNQHLIPRVARQCDLFSLGMTIFQFLMPQTFKLAYPEFNVMEEEDIQTLKQELEVFISQQNPNFQNLQIQKFNQLQELSYCLSVKNTIQKILTQIAQNDPLFPLYQLLDQLITFDFLPTPNLVEINQAFDVGVEAELTMHIYEHRKRQEIIQQRI